MSLLLEDDRPAYSPGSGAKQIGGHWFFLDRGVDSSTTIEDVFNGFPHGDQFPEFPGQLDRDLYQHTPRGAHEPMGPHEITDTCPRHLQPEHIAKRARCTHHEAVQLSDALAILDSDPKLSNEVCRWAFARGVDATLKYLHPFLIGVAEAETEPPDQYTDLTVKQLESLCRSVGSKACGRTRRSWVAAAQRFENSLIEDPPAETLGYHTLSESEECDWIESQPGWFQVLIESVQQAENIARLKDIGKAVFASNLTGNHASVFWSFYNARKVWLERKIIVRDIAHKITNRIEAADHKQLAALGNNLFRLQKGLIKGPFINTREWSHIWAAYHQRREQLANHKLAA
jgi:hypothetical protein